MPQLKNNAKSVSQVSLKFHIWFIWRFKMSASNPSYSSENAPVKKNPRYYSFPVPLRVGGWVDVCFVLTEFSIWPGDSSGADHGSLLLVSHTTEGRRLSWRVSYPTEGRRLRVDVCSVHTVSLSGLLIPLMLVLQGFTTRLDPTTYFPQSH